MSISNVTGNNNTPISIAKSDNDTSISNIKGSTVKVLNSIKISHNDWKYYNFDLNTKNALSSEVMAVP